MIVIVCVDDNNGMLFNHRRQSRDVKLREYILAMCNGKKLWMNSYSADQFDISDGSNIAVNDNFMSEAGKDEFCFVETKPLAAYEKWIDKIIIFRWNRVYPSDMKFDIPLSEHGWSLLAKDEFRGNSHNKISMEVYGK